MKKGFTLIELMIVIAIIAIIAAIAIPGLLAAQRSSNERNASASLKTLATAEADFRSNDRDNDRAQNFWTGNVYGLFALCPSTNGSAVPTTLTADLMIKLVEPSLASADGNVAATVTGQVVVTASVGSLSPKASYVYRSFATYAVGTGQGNYGVTGGITGWGTNFNFGKYAFMAFPTSYGAGRQIFIMDETITIFRGDPGSAYTMSYTGGTSSSTSTWSGTVGGVAQTQALGFPTSPGGSGWTKLD
jgi:prepilin-type N-terminal cleavage/methylation domain-containing protein